MDSGVSMRHSCQKTWESTVENGQQAKQSQRSSFSFKTKNKQKTPPSKPQDRIVYTDGSVTKDQSGWGFTVKQGATTIHEDSAAYTVSTSSMTMEVETVTHALRWTASRDDSQTTHAILLIYSMSLLRKVKNGMGSREWNVSMDNFHLRNLLWVYCPEHDTLTKGLL